MNNPTYYGICSDLRSIVKLAHEHGMLCLVDEAHGTHFISGKYAGFAMAAGAIWRRFRCTNQAEA